MAYPNDDQYEDATIETVEAHDSGYEVKRADHWSLWVPMYEGGKPKVGSAIRIYGKGIGFSFRGIYIDGVKVFYRTDEEDREHQEIQRYGADAADWLSRWDEGRGVWSIEMGGLGPGYEQCIQILCAETLRFLLKTKPDLAAMEADEAAWKVFRSEMRGMREALIDATAHLAGAASAYRKYARRHRAVGQSEIDPFFATRADDFDKAVERSRAALSLEGEDKQATRGDDASSGGAT